MWGTKNWFRTVTMATAFAERQRNCICTIYLYVVRKSRQNELLTFFSVVADLPAKQRDTEYEPPKSTASRREKAMKLYETALSPWTGSALDSL